MVQKRFAVIDFIRLYLILALILCHAFAPFNSAWPSISQCEICTYKWVARVSYASLLETFVLISGFLFWRKLSRGIPLIELIKDKFKRLYIPSLIIGVLYVVVLGLPMNSTTVVRVLNGIGNLWFLPMLYGVFIIYWCASKYISNRLVLTLILSIIAIFPYPTLPFQINNSLYYLFFFHVGCMLASKPKLSERLTSPRILTLLLISYVMVFIISFYIRDHYLNIYDGLTFVQKSTLICAKHICRFSYSIIGVFVIYSFFSIISKYIKNDLSSIAGLCFGIYLLHEMILRVLYYRIHIVESIDIVYAPWLAALITLLVSIATVRCLKYFKFSRYIL